VNERELRVEYRGRDLAALRRSTTVELDADTGSLQLVRRVLVADEMGACNGRDVELVRGSVVARKQFLLETANVFSARVVAFLRCDTDAARLLVGVNGHQTELAWQAPEATPGKFEPYWFKEWRTIEAPHSWLRSGLNDVTFQAAEENGAAAWELLIECSRHPNRSARSLDRGRTWDDAHLGHNGAYDGEYLVRLDLERYAPEGTVTSDAISLAELAAGGPLGNRVEVLEVSVQAEGPQPPDTAIAFHVRSGSTPDYEPATWCAWTRADDFRPRPGDRYLQWMARLSTSNPRATPQLRAITISARVLADELIWGRVSSADNPRIVRSDWAFAYQPNTERLRILRERWNLGEVVAAGRTEFEKAVLLRQWVREQWDGWRMGACHFTTPWDSLVILEMCSRDLAHGMCTHYSTVFVHCAAALGMVARHVIIRGHCCAELYSNDHQKWVLMDPGGDANHSRRSTYHCERDGTPLSALETHRAWASGNWHDVRLVGHRAEEFQTEDRIAHLSHFFIANRSDQMVSLHPGEPEHGMSSYRYDGYLWWKDADTPVLPMFSHWSGREGDFYWSVNRTRIHLLRGRERGAVEVQLETATPNFRRYLAAFDNAPAEERGAAFLWNLHAGDNRLSVRAENAFAVPGPEAAVVVRFDPRG